MPRPCHPKVPGRPTPHPRRRDKSGTGCGWGVARWGRRPTPSPFQGPFQADQRSAGAAAPDTTPLNHFSLGGPGRKMLRRTGSFL